MSSLIAGFLTSDSLRTFRQLHKHLPYYSRTVGTVRKSADADDDEDEEDERSICSDPATSDLDQCSSSAYTSNNAPIPFTLHSDVPVLAVCSSNGFFDPYPTLAVTTYQPEMSSGAQFCINGAHSTSHALLSPCVWLVLGSYVLVVITGAMGRKPKKSLGPELAIDEATKATQPMKPGELVYISGAPLPTPEEVIQRTIQQYSHYSDSDPAHGFPDWEPLAPKLAPIALASSSSWHNTLRNNPDVLFRGDIAPDALDNKDPPTKASTMSRAFSAPNIITKLDVPPMPPCIPSVSVTPVGYADSPSSTPRRRVNVATQSSTSTPTGTPARHRPPPINTGTPRASKMYRDPSYRCFNPSPLKNVSSASTPSSKSSPSLPTLQTPVLKTPALSDNGLKQSMWAPKV